MKLSNVQKSELYDWKQFNEGKAQIKKYHNTKKATNKQRGNITKEHMFNKIKSLKSKEETTQLKTHFIY